MQYIIGIDCGASSSQAVVVPYFYIPASKIQRDILRKGSSSGGRAVLFGLAGGMPHVFQPVNYNVLGFDESARRLIKIIKDVGKGCPISSIVSVAAGVSGARYEEDRMKLESYIKLKTKIKNVSILPDTEIALAAAFEPGRKNCGILIAGTGSVLYCRDSRGKICRIGGWGRLIGDEGSGYWIARTALSHVTKQYDKRGRKTLLAGLIEKNFGLNADSLISRVYHNGFALAKITKYVFRAAGGGDKLSSDIIKLAAAELAGHFVPLKRKSYEIALMGSLFTEEKLLEKELKKIITSRYKNIKLIKPNLKPVWGAVRIANSIASKVV